MMKLILSITFTVVLFASANGLKCYLCSSITSPGCVETGFDSSDAFTSTPTCDSGEICVKTVIGDLIGRGCAPEDPSATDGCTELTGTKICYASCSTDLCNKATNSKQPGILLMAIAFFVVKYICNASIKN